MSRKNICSMIILTLLLVFHSCFSPQAAIANEPKIGAKSAVLIDVYNGQVLYEKDALQKRPMASTTKVMTAVVALGGSDLHSNSRVSKNADQVGESSMHLEEGEILTLEQLLYGALMPSGNDACVAIAEHVAGSEGFFVLLMNEKAALIGAVDSCFKNTNGLPEKGHYSTALDLALITRYALHNPVFCDVVKTKFKVVKGPDSLDHYLKNTNKLLWSYPWADGVKTGTTLEAGQCLIASANKGERRLLAVVLKDNNRFADAETLFNYGFNEFNLVRKLYQGEIYTRVPVVNGASKEVPVMVANNITINLRDLDLEHLEQKVQIPRLVNAPVQEGERLGNIEYYLGGHEVGSAEIIAASSVQEASVIQKIKKKTILYWNLI
ncbi:D-alanyl-D-alanine carboxypeptidase (penicillin-binding protein 5/6) [Desulfotomaculum arcticum]|uniref:serine-type D-Ala-D-Ala carboxypeptidase n=1 Tax=Desulfotruncus arcticus DSM 17038 TaxID=1121424 RepID=A0A1I2SGI4_9FIRM|nr:D-alanyl-D-alanine carboxypeptidase family protein [Desulfotruncus arcticus]SFG49246.1 D-alanyl-D-alanine carboxypeptidase (penicillin-binding protein 5/6) [Desulfotomaculum arcticum] [Desulfotruncus arcticus DSM 17038]